MWGAIIGIALAFVGAALQGFSPTQQIQGQPVLSQSQIAALNAANMQATLSDSTVVNQLTESENSAVQNAFNLQGIFTIVGITIAVYAAYKLIKK